MKLSAVMFDVGGTLVDGGRAGVIDLGIKGAGNALKALKARGRSVPSQVVFFQKVLGILGGAALANRGKFEEVSLEKEAAKLFEACGTPLSGEDLAAALDAWYEPFSEQARVIPGVADSLEAVRQKGLKTAAVSNSVWLERHIRGDIERLGFGGYFDAVVVSSEVGIRKPHPKMFQTALERLSVKASECLFVGDSPHDDIGGASYLGFHTVLVDRDGAAKSKVAASEFVINSMEEFPGLLSKAAGV